MAKITSYPSPEPKRERHASAGMTGFCGYCGCGVLTEGGEIDFHEPRRYYDYCDDYRSTIKCPNCGKMVTVFAPNIPEECQPYDPLKDALLNIGEG